MSKKFVRKWSKRESHDLIDLMDRISNDLSINFETANEDAQKILKDALTRARANNKNQT